MSELKQFWDGFKSGVKGFGECIAVIINTVLLSVVYIIGVGITSIVAKISGKHFLENKISKRSTYWTNLNLKKKHIDTYYRQF